MCVPAEAFLLIDPTEQAACVLLDVRLPGAGPQTSQHRPSEDGTHLPIVLLSGERRVEDSSLLEAVRVAMARVSDDRTAQVRCQRARDRYALLTPRERQVLSHLISGQLNKQIAFDLGIAESTVKIHRGRVLAKMEANSIPDLVRLAGDLGIPPEGKVR
jgi:FixJ family two-component response regulator